MENLCRVSEAKKRNLPVASSTLYKWHHLKRYPEIFRKFSGFLFVDIKALEDLIAASIKNN